MDFSVLMATYAGEQPEYLDAALTSILVKQTCPPSQVVLVLDGPIGAPLEEIVKKYSEEFPDILDVIRCKENRGPSKASQEGMKYIKYDLVARMDSDDISAETRFEQELAIMQEHPELSVVGGWISEFDSDPAMGTSIRVVPEQHAEILNMFPKRMPINNVTAMIRRNAIEKAGGYGRDTVNEDYSLYAHMWVNGEQFYNIQEILVNVRVGNGMTERRTDIRIFTDWCKDQKYLKEHGKESLLTACVSCIRCLGFVLMPPKIKAFLYSHFLRNSSTAKE